MRPRIIAGLFGVIFLLIFVASAFPVPVSAAQAPFNLTQKQVKDVKLQWLTRAKIKAIFNEGTENEEKLIFFDRDINDGTRNYQVRGYGDCFGEIDVNDKYTTGTVDMDFIPPNQRGGECQNTNPGEFNKPIKGSGGASDLVYILSTNSTINQIDDKGPIFRKDDKRKNEDGSLFLNKDDDDGCEDRIWFDANRENGTFKLYILTKGDRDLNDSLLGIPKGCRLMNESDNKPGSSKYSKALSEYIVSPSTTPTTSGKSWHPILTEANETDPDQGGGAGGVFGDGGGSGEDLEFQCTLSINPLTWLVCPMIEGAKVVIEQLDNAITNELTIDVDEFMSDDTTAGKAFHDAWRSIRNISMALLVIAALIMVISQAIGGGRS